MSPKEPKKPTAAAVLFELAAKFQKVSDDEEKRAECLALRHLLSATFNEQAELKHSALQHYQISCDYDYAADQVRKVCGQIDCGEITTLV